MDTSGLQPAYVLHTRRYGDTSLLVEFLSREQGRLAAIAKGALRGRQAGGRIEPFWPLLIQLRGRGEVLSVVHSESAGAPLVLRGRDLYCGLYLNELVLKLTARLDACPPLFDDYADALAGLAGQPDPEPVLRRFEASLLANLGLGLSLDRDAHGEPIRPNGKYTYDVDGGARPSRGEGAQTVSGKTLLALRDGVFGDADCLLEARALMRRILNHHLEGRPLRSRELFR